MDSKTRAKLRSLANPIEAILQVGKNGLGDALQKQVDDALTAREMIKLTVLETCPETPREMAAVLAKLSVGPGALSSQHGFMICGFFSFRSMTLDW